MSNTNERLPRDLAGLRLRPPAMAPLVGGRTCLDFANTVSGWRKVAGKAPAFEPLEDRLRDYADLLAWAEHAAVVDAGAAGRLLREAHRRPAEADAVGSRARRLRHAIYRTGRLIAQARTPQPDDLDVLLAEVQAAREHDRLQASARGLTWSTDADPRALDRLLWPVARSAAAYFTAGDLSRLRVCPGEDCAWLFEDTSRNRSRRWCEMSDCGNLDKVRRFRTRQSAG